MKFIKTQQNLEEVITEAMTSDTVLWLGQTALGTARRRCDIRRKVSTGNKRGRRGPAHLTPASVEWTEEPQPYQWSVAGAPEPVPPDGKESHGTNHSRGPGLATGSW